ncbi:hypothetical protein H0A65_03260 [Alcaligenaceae bacterium]|nr:hypothetical protein [Alcaligenaceae bacterium]
MSGLDFQEGLDTARMLVVKCVTLPIEEQEQVVLDALLDLINLPLGWNNLESTRDRLAGFVRFWHSPLARHALSPRSTARRQARIAAKREGK